VDDPEKRSVSGARVVSLLVRKLQHQCADAAIPENRIVLLGELVPRRLVSLPRPSQRRLEKLKRLFTSAPLHTASSAGKGLADVIRRERPAIARHTNSHIA
jgi:hypothetical protein